MQTLIDFLFLAVVNALWMTPLLVLAVEAAARLFGPTRSRVIYRLWMLCFLLSLAAPMLPALLHQAVRNQTLPPATSALSAGEQTSSQVNAMERIQSWTGAIDQPAGAIPGGPMTLEIVLCALYAATVLFALFRLEIGLAHTHRVVGDAGAALISTEVDQDLRAIAAQFGLAPVDVLTSRFLDSPAVVHWPQPMLLLPSTLTTEDSGEMRTIICHELAHIRRRDFFANLLIELFGSLLYFHPAAHWMRRRITESRELACDELAATARESKPAYARDLLRLAERFNSTSIFQPVCVLGIFEGGILEKRVMNLIEKKYSTRQLVIAIAATTVLVSAACLICSQYGVNPLHHQVVRTASSASVFQSVFQLEPKDDIWHLYGSKGQHFASSMEKGAGGRATIAMDIDPQNSYLGQPAYLMKRIDGSENGGGMAGVLLDPKPYLGKRVRVHSMLKLGDFKSKEGTPLELEVLNLQGVMYENTYIRGTYYHAPTGWTSVDYVVDVPQQSAAIELFIRPTGKFNLWVTEPKVEVVPSDTPLTKNFITTLSERAEKMKKKAS
jgi:beta-lactamase regulating signal transducer with metallopeptidase domain